jgi:hypothetical protein
MALAAFAVPTVSVETKPLAPPAPRNSGSPVIPVLPAAPTGGLWAAQ